MTNQLSSRHPSHRRHCRRSPVATLLAAATLALLLGTVRTVEGARVLRANAAAVYTIWDADDACNQPMQTKDCTLDVTCSACLTRPGCAVESTTGKCVSATRIVNTTTTAADTTVEFFITGQSQYCDANDNACSACSADNDSSDAVCKGAGGCVCVHQCEVAAAHAKGCEASQESFNLYYILIAAALLAPTLVMKSMYKGLTTGIVTISERREMRRAERNAHPLTMKLDGWRGFIAREQNDQTETIEVKLCPTRSVGNSSESASTPPQPSDWDLMRDPRRNLSEASTECDDNESKEDDSEYVSVTTPKSM